MIALGSSVARHFVGRLDPGDNLLASIMEFCSENNVKSAWLQAVAVISGLEIKTLNPGHGFAGEPDFMDGQWFCPTITGSLSDMAGRRDLRLYAECHSGDGRTVAGLIVGGVVEMFEFRLWVSDDVIVQRDATDREFAAITNLVPLRMKRAAPAKKSDQKPVEDKAAEPPREDSLLEEDLIAAMEPGDFVHHPTLGKCRIVSKPAEGKIKIRLGNGRIANLGTRILEISPYQVINGNRVYPVKVKKT